MARPGFVKDEACNPSGSFARRAANAVYHAKRSILSKVIAATSGNHGAAVGKLQAAMQGLKCIIVQNATIPKGSTA